MEKLRSRGHVLNWLFAKSDSTSQRELILLRQQTPDSAGSNGERRPDFQELLRAVPTFQYAEAAEERQNVAYDTLKPLSEFLFGAAADRLGDSDQWSNVTHDFHRLRLAQNAKHYKRSANDRETVTKQTLNIRKQFFPHE